MGIMGARWVCGGRDLRGFSELLTVSTGLKMQKPIVGRGLGVLSEVLSWGRAILGSLGLWSVCLTGSLAVSVPGGSRVSTK